MPLFKVPMLLEARAVLLSMGRSAESSLRMFEPAHCATLNPKPQTLNLNLIPKNPKP
jgi:hypothetical protein